MRNRHYARTSDPTNSKALLAYLGEDITLPDNTGIRAIIHTPRTTEADNLYSNVFSTILYARIPTANLGTLAAQQVVTYAGAAHYVPTLQPTGKGWSAFTLERL